MHKKGHIGAGLLATAPVVFVVTAAGFSTLALAGAGVVAVGSMLPDVDMRLPFVTHRGPTHTVWFAGALGVVYGVVGALLGSGAGALATVAIGGYAALLGALTVGAHLLADALTPMGIRPFEPVDERDYSLSVTRAANPLANYALLAVGGVAVATAFLAGGMVA